jgi:hypothetical protein
MPSDFPLGPKLLKGAQLVYESQTPGPPVEIDNLPVGSLIQRLHEVE